MINPTVFLDGTLPLELKGPVMLPIFLLLLVAPPEPDPEPPTKGFRPDLVKRLANLPAQAKKDKLPPEKVVELYYKAALQRPPRPDEARVAILHLAKGDVDKTRQEVLWALVMTKEFMAVHKIPDVKSVQSLWQDVLDLWKKDK